MIMNDIDVFHHFDLPFETYFHKEIHQKTQILDELEIIWVLRGRLEISCEGKKFVLGRQNVFMMNPFHTHILNTTEESIIISYRLKKDYLVKSNQTFKDMSFELKVHSFEELVTKYKEVPLLIAELLRLLLDPNPSVLIRYKIIGFYNMFIYELYNMLLKEKYLDIKKKDVPIYLERIEKITEYLNKNFLHKVTLDDLTNHIGISRFRLSHFIKEQIGISFRDYLFNMRLEYALRLLRDSDMNIVEISRLAGFSDVKYLNKMMKERFQQTALKYRKEFKEKTINHSNTSNIQDFFQELNRCLTKLEHYTLQ